MKSPEQSAEQDPLEHISKLVGEFPQAIETEFSTTVNPWGQCYGSCVVAVSFLLEASKGLISIERYQAARAKIDELNQVVQNLIQRYPTKAKVPSAEEKRELMAKLEVFRDL